MKIDKQEINTEGGANFQGDVNIGSGDIIGRDKHVYGDEVRGDKNETIIFSTNVTLISAEHQIASLLNQADTQDTARLLNLLLQENQRDQQEKGFVREEVDQSLLSRMMNLISKPTESNYKTHLPFLKNGLIFMNRFKIKGFIGRGGFADAYIAWDMTHDKEAVLKRFKVDPFVKTVRG